jgi:aspartate/methionine/tyrosine aminotransferase
VARGVLLAPGGGFGDDFRQFARLCFTSEPLPRLVEGLTRLRAAVLEVEASG